MARIKLPSYLNSVSGRIEDAVIYTRRGTNCMRIYVVPRNPDTEAQRAVRSSFRDAVHAWQALPDNDKFTWNRRARRNSMSGYNMFISAYMRTEITALSDASSTLQLSFNTVSSPYAQRFLSVQPFIPVKKSSYSAPVRHFDAG